MILPGNHAEFRKLYQDYTNEVLDPTAAEMRGLLQRWKGDYYWAKHKGGAFGTGLTVPSPIRDFSIRIKRPESVEDKIRRRADIFPDGWAIASAARMDDALGARVIVHFLSDLSMVHHELLVEMADELEISTDYPPRAYLPDGYPERLNLHSVQRADKESGYLSVHYTVRLRHSRVAPDERPWFELQVRTLVEDAWAEIHHLIGYKREKDTQVDVEDETRLINGHLRVIDLHFDMLHSRLAKAQLNAATPEDDNLVNAENLPALLRALDLQAAQREIDGLLRALASAGIETVGAFRGRFPQPRVAKIEHAWFSATGRKAQTFDIIGLAGTFSDTSSDNEVVEQVKSWVKLANRTRRRNDGGPVDRLISTLRHYQVSGAGRVRTLANTDRVSLISDVWAEVAGREIRPLEVVAILALLPTEATDQAVRDATQTVGAWKSPAITPG